MDKKFYNAESLGRTLRNFEERNGMTSEEFYEKVMAGESIDVRRFERSVWASVYRDYCRLNGGDFAASVSRALQLA